MDRRKDLLNGPERLTLDALSTLAKEHDCQVFPKVRIADVLSIESSRISDDLYGYALKAHFDFVLNRGPNATPLFAVEFDGPGHRHDLKAIERDRKKDKICIELGLPLLRIDSAMLKKVGQRSIVGWLALMWFMNEAWEQTPHPWDEEFDNQMWFKINPGLEKAVTEIMEHGSTVINGVLISGETSLNHPELRKLCKMQIDEEMDPFHRCRQYFFKQAKNGYTAKVGRLYRSASAACHEADWVIPS